MYSVIVDDENQTVLADNLTLKEAEVALCRACNESIEAYIDEDEAETKAGEQPKFE